MDAKNHGSNDKTAPIDPLVEKLVNRRLADVDGSVQKQKVRLDRAEGDWKNKCEEWDKRIKRLEELEEKTNPQLEQLQKRIAVLDERSEAMATRLGLEPLDETVKKSEAFVKKHEANALKEFVAAFMEEEFAVRKEIVCLLDYNIEKDKEKLDEIIKETKDPNHVAVLVTFAGTKTKAHKR